MELRYCEKCGDVLRVETAEPLNPVEHFVCDGCKTGASASRNAGGASTKEYDESLRQEELNLFSPGTIAVRKKELEELAREQPKPKLKLVKSAAEAAEGARAPTKVDSARVKSGKKLLFRCLHCRSTLAIRAVEKTSKLVCPHCSQSMFVTPAGRLHKSPPSSALRKTAEAPSSGAPPRSPSGRTLSEVTRGSSRRIPTSGGSSAVRRTAGSSVARKAGSSAVRRAGPGSSAVRKPGSSAVRRKSPSVTADAPQAPLYLDGVPLGPTQAPHPGAPDEPTSPMNDLVPADFESPSETLSPAVYGAEEPAGVGFEPAEPQPSQSIDTTPSNHSPVGKRCAGFLVSVLQGLCLLACLTGPIFLAGGFSSLTASAESTLKSPVPPQVLDRVEEVGEQGLRGLQSLMGVAGN
jgi:hypothetical protein